MKTNEKTADELAVMGHSAITCVELKNAIKAALDAKDEQIRELAEAAFNLRRVAEDWCADSLQLSLPDRTRQWCARVAANDAVIQAVKRALTNLPDELKEKI